MNSVGLKIKNNEPLIFIHTPKCGGTYVAQILKDLNIKNKGHKQAIKNEGITFTIIRDPIQRFESLLNYRLGEIKPRTDWPKHLKHVYEDKSITLNEIVSKMSDNEIKGFTPYKTLTYWTQNVNIIITINKLPQLLNFFNYYYDINKYEIKNVSTKIRGKLNDQTKERLKKIFKDDLILFNKINGNQLLKK